MDQTQTFKSLAAREAQQANYGDASYWEYLDRHAEELAAKGIRDALTRTLAEALKGNDGD
jgi:cation transport regulator ChaC